MKLRDSEFLFIDLQTTGMRPTSGNLLEMAWAFASAQTSQLTTVSHLIAQPEGAFVSKRIAELTGITADDMKEARAKLEVLELFRPHIRPLSLIHYAQFERPFLRDLFGLAETADLPFEIICTHQIARRLVPGLPTKGVRGLAGYFGTPIEGELKRASSHVHATWIIWRGLVTKLEEMGVTTVSDLQDWLAQPSKVKRGKYEYPIERMKRLELPDQPGVYRMLAKNGTVLYVGKATSLKSRVNSYFRGQKNRDRQKLEMLTQVWDLDVTPCATPLEAALLETDEIKRLDPPYNISLKARSRHLVFYSRDLDSLSLEQDEAHPLGPFTSVEVLAPLLLLSECLKQKTFSPDLFFEPLPLELIEQGWDIYRSRHKWPCELTSRQLLAHGLFQYREWLKQAALLDDQLNDQPEEMEEVEESMESESEEVELTPEDVADKFARLFLRAGRAYHRSRLLTRLLNADIEYVDRKVARELHIRHGQMSSANTASGPRWQGLDLTTYDRMRVLLTELGRVGPSVFIRYV